MKDSELDPTASPDTIPNADSEPLPGAFRYDIKQVLGRGGMGEVLLARDPQVGRDVALKRMRSNQPSLEAVQRFQREALVQARLDHPAIVPVHEIGTDGEGRPYFTMKRLAGTTLAEMIAKQSGQQSHQLRALAEVCLAIELAHTRGIVHRDLKPANIMLGDYGEVYVLDWGVARVLDESDPATRDTTIVIPSLDAGTETGRLLGTPGYMAPEHVQGVPVGPAADVYSLGAILFEILAGQPLHPRGSAALVTTLEEGRTSPATRFPDRGVPPELDGACVEALVAEPSRRPTARQLGERIQRYLDGDRDVERRRALAREQLAAAQQALAADDRITALRSAGRAVALDPESQEATTLLATLIVEPPKQLPPVLARELATHDAAMSRRHSRRAVVPFLCFFLVAPTLPYLHIVNWGWLAAVTAGVLLTAGLSYVNANVRYVAPFWLLTSQLALVIAFSRFEGPLVLTPVLIAGMLVGMTSIGRFAGRAWLVYGWVVVATLAPIVLELAGVLAPTFEIRASGVFSFGSVFGERGTANVVGLIAGNSALLVVVATYVIATENDRRTAQRELFVQAWQLRQLLPRGTGGALGA